MGGWCNSNIGRFRTLTCFLVMLLVITTNVSFDFNFNDVAAGIIKKCSERQMTDCTTLLVHGQIHRFMNHRQAVMKVTSITRCFMCASSAFSSAIWASNAAVAALCYVSSEILASAFCSRSQAAFHISCYWLACCLSWMCSCLVRMTCVVMKGAGANAEVVSDPETWALSMF